MEQRTSILYEIIEESHQNLAALIMLSYAKPTFGENQNDISLIDMVFLNLNHSATSVSLRLIITLVYSRALVRHKEHERAFNLL